MINDLDVKLTHARGKGNERMNELTPFMHELKRDIPGRHMMVPVFPQAARNYRSSYRPFYN